MTSQSAQPWFEYCFKSRKEKVTVSEFILQIAFQSRQNSSLFRWKTFYGLRRHSVTRVSGHRLLSHLEELEAPFPGSYITPTRNLSLCTLAQTDLSQRCRRFKSRPSRPRGHPEPRLVPSPAAGLPACLSPSLLSALNTALCCVRLGGVCNRWLLNRVDTLVIHG